MQNFFKSFLISLFFLLSEILRSKLFGGLPLNLTAHIWAFNSEFIQVAKIFGVFGLSFNNSMVCFDFKLAFEKMYRIKHFVNSYFFSANTLVLIYKSQYKNTKDEQ